MSFFLFIKIFFVCLVGAMSPGPSMFVIISNALKSKIKGFMASIGHGLGIGIYALFAVIGLDLLAENYESIFLFLKFISILFLFYMGLTSYLSKNEFENEITIDKNKENYIAFTQGFMISILNPKIFIFFAAIYSQFISIENNQILNITLVTTAMLVDTLWYIVLTFLITFIGFNNFFKRNILIIKKTVGLIFIIISIALLINLLL